MGSDLAIPFLNQSSGSAIHARAMRMEACSPIAARHTAGAQDCEHDVAWADTYPAGIDYTATASRCGSAGINRHRASASCFIRFPAGVEYVRAKAFLQLATEIGVERLCNLRLLHHHADGDGGVPLQRALRPDGHGTRRAARRQPRPAWVLEVTQAKEFALAHRLVFGVLGVRLFARCFDAASTIHENIPGDVLASLTTPRWKAPAKAWNADAPMDDASFDRRQTLRFGCGVAFAQIGIIGFDAVIKLEALRLYTLPEAAPAVLNGPPTLPNPRQRCYVGETEVDLLNLTPGAEHLFDVTVSAARQGDLCCASLATSSRFVQVAGHVWINTIACVVARNVLGFSVDLPRVMLAVEMRKHVMI